MAHEKCSGNNGVCQNYINVYPNDSESYIFQEIANFPESVRQKWPQVKQRHNSKPSTPIPSEKQTLFNTPLSSIPQRQPRRLDQKVDSDPRKRLLF